MASEHPHIELIETIEKAIEQAEGINCSLTAHRLKQALDAAKWAANENGYNYVVVK